MRIYRATPQEVFIVRSADHAGVTSSTAVVDDGVLQFDIAPNEKWAMTVHMFMTASAAGSHRETITVPAGATGIMHWMGTSTFGAAFATDLGEPSQANVSILMSTLVTNAGNAGTVKVRYAQFAPDATPTIMKAGSFLWAKKVP